MLSLPRMSCLAVVSLAVAACGSTVDYRIGGNTGDTGPGTSTDTGTGAGADAGSDAGTDAGGGTDTGAPATDGPCGSGTAGCLDAPRLVAPMSTASVTTVRPTLRWSLGTGLDGARVEVCRDRGCATVEQSQEVTGAHTTPAFDLAPGVHFWRVTGRAGGRLATPTSRVWEFFVGRRAVAVDTVSGSVPDFNGDGYADVAVGATTAAAPTGANQGAVYVYYGSALGLASAPGLSLPGPDGPGSFAGRSVAGVGDLDGDGFADMVVGAYGVAGDVGKTYVYYGSAAGLDPARRSTLVGLDGANAHFGSLVAGAGDTDGDGYGDLAVGAYGVNHSTGRVYVFQGGPTGVDPSRRVVLDGPDGIDGDFGVAVAGAGDTDGDGYSDLVVGALGVGTSTGRAYVFRGGPGGVDAARRVTLNSPDGAGGWFGRWVAGLGDVNGDGYPDVAVAEDHVDSGAGKVWVYYGGATGMADARRVLLGGVAGTAANFGNAVTGAGDVNGDGYADVLVGAQQAAMVTGGAYLYLGGADGPGTMSAMAAHNREPDVSLAGPDGAGGQFGRTVIGAGDVNGDGYADLAVGADQVGNNAGRVYVYLGSATLPGAPPSRMDLGRDPQTVLTAPSGEGGHFGWDVASLGGTFVRGGRGVGMGLRGRSRCCAAVMEL